jgi:hypothetical protein
VKFTIEVRPMFQRVETAHPCPRAAVLAGAAADPGGRAAHRSDLATDRRELGRLHAITVRGVVGAVVQTTAPSTTQSAFAGSAG